MGFWNHLIMNHLMLANHASWAIWLRLRSPEQWSHWLIGNNTYRCMRSDECWGSRRVSLFSDLHRWFEQTWVYLLDETFEKFKEFQSEVENHRNKKIKFLRSDHGKEYLSYEFGLLLKQCGILSQLTPPRTPQRNGVSERRNRTLLNMMRSMMSLTDLSLSFWGYTLGTTAFTLKRGTIYIRRDDALWTMVWQETKVFVSWSLGLRCLWEKVSSW